MVLMLSVQHDHSLPLAVSYKACSCNPQCTEGHSSSPMKTKVLPAPTFPRALDAQVPKQQLSGELQAQWPDEVQSSIQPAGKHALAGHTCHCPNCRESHRMPVPGSGTHQQHTTLLCGLCSKRVRAVLVSVYRQCFFLVVPAATSKSASSSGPIVLTDY